MSCEEACTKAIAAHAAWKSRFRDFMAGKVDLDPKVVERPDACEFGQWLHQFAHELPAARRQGVVAAHAEFHRCAATVVRSKKAGKHAEAEESLGHKGDFGRASASLTLAVVAARDGK